MIQNKKNQLTRVNRAPWLQERENSLSWGEAAGKKTEEEERE